MENPLGKTNPLGQQAVIFPPYIICIGNKSPERVTVKVGVIFLLSARSLMGTDFVPLVAMVSLPTETYELGV